jgi:hypothetical protein
MAGVKARAPVPRRMRMHGQDLHPVRPGPQSRSRETRPLQVAPAVPYQTGQAKIKNYPYQSTGVVREAVFA